MEKQRVIFDLDGTLLTHDYQEERKLFYDSFHEQAPLLLDSMGKLLGEYENRFPCYEERMLANYLPKKTGVNVTPEFIREWIHELAFIDDKMEDGIVEVLEDYKKRGKSLAVLTNWFGETQIPRLRNAGLLDYFDEVYTGDLFLKPKPIAFFTAIQHYQPRECLFVGDHLERDYIGPRACGFDSVLYDKEEINHESVVKVKSLRELVGKY